MRVDLSGLDAHAIVQAAQPALRDIRDAAERQARTDCPVDTGAMKASIYSDLDGSTGVIEVGARVDYALYVEMGHRAEGWVPQPDGSVRPASGRWVPAQPFLRPVLTRFGAST